MKTCTRCRAEKPRSEFYQVKSRNTPDGLLWECKACCSARGKAQYRKYARAKYNAQRKAWAAGNKDKIAAASQRYAKRNPDKIRAAARNFTAKVRREFLDAYGRVCVCCGETEEAFLTLEHLKLDGASHRKQVKNAVYLDLRRRGWPKEDYAVMCMNCNWARRNGEPCPHELKRGVTNAA